MSDSVHHVTLWVHILSMVGAFGSLLIAQLALTANDTANARILRTVNVLVAIGFLAGCFVYFLIIKTAASAGDELPGRVHMVVGIKLLILLGVGGCSGMAAGLTKKGKWEAAGRLRWIATGLLAIAAYLGVSL